MVFCGRLFKLLGVSLETRGSPFEQHDLWASPPFVHGNRQAGGTPLGRDKIRKWESTTTDLASRIRFSHSSSCQPHFDSYLMRQINALHFHSVIRQPIQYRHISIPLHNLSSTNILSTNSLFRRTIYSAPQPIPSPLSLSFSPNSLSG